MADGSNNMNMCGLKPHGRLLGLQWAAGKRISKEEGDNPLISSSTGSCSGVINFGLSNSSFLTVWIRFRSSSLPRVYVDYYFYVEAVACVNVVVWFSLRASSSLVFWRFFECL